LAFWRAAACVACALGAQAQSAPPKTLAELLAASPAGDWRRLDPQRVLYMELASGRVVIELAPDFAPRHVDNIRILTRASYFDGLAIVRAQDKLRGAVGRPEEKRPLGEAKKTLAPEFSSLIAGSPAFTLLPDRDTYAPQAGFAAGFSRCPRSRQRPRVAGALLRHGRGGTRQRRRFGQRLRALRRDRQCAAPPRPQRDARRRVVQGIELLSALRAERGRSASTSARRSAPRSAKCASAPTCPPTGASTSKPAHDSATFRQMVEMRRFRRDDWYKEPAGHVDVCNVPLPVRAAKSAAAR